MFVSRPRVLKHTESKSDISFVPNTEVSRHISREIVQFQKTGKLTAIRKDFSSVWYLQVFLILDVTNKK